VFPAPEEGLVGKDPLIGDNPQIPGENSRFKLKKTDPRSLPGIGKAVELSRRDGHEIPPKSFPGGSVYGHGDFSVKNEEYLVILMPMGGKHKFGERRIPASKGKREAEGFFFLPGYLFHRSIIPPGGPVVKGKFPSINIPSIKVPSGKISRFPPYKIVVFFKKEALHSIYKVCYTGFMKNRVLFRNGRLWVWLVMAAGLHLSACVSQQSVVVGISRDLTANYALYPSIEVDVLAVSDEDLDSIKNAGVETYFAPNSGFREKMAPQTFFFSEEQTKPQSLASRSERWKQWLDKDPSTLVIIAGLPHDPEMPAPPAPDPRILTFPIKKRFVFTPKVYVLVEPKKIVQVKKAPANPKDGL
jgi:hypothetical protein